MQLYARLVSVLILLTFVLAGLGLYLHPGSGYGWLSYFDRWLFSIVRFSIWQALLSAILSVLLAWPFAWVLSRRPFRGQWLIKGLLNLLFVMPVLVVILGVVSAYSDWFNVFSLRGILIAHLYLNVPFAIRFFWQSLENISRTHYQLGASIGFGAFHNFRWLEWPVLLRASRSVFVLVFLLCFSSFTVVLTLGGGPANTNLEVAVYQALRLDFDPRASVLYASVHALIAITIMLLAGRRYALGIELDRQRHQREACMPSFVQWIVLISMSGLLLWPLVSLIASAFSSSWAGSTRLLPALATSIRLSLGSGFVALFLALGRAVSPANRLTQITDYGLLMLPVMVVITGLFLLTLKAGIAFQITELMIVWVNGLMAMPLLTPQLRNRLDVYRSRYQPLSDSLGFSPAAQFRFIFWPAVRGILPWCLALSMVLSFGDLGVAAMIGAADFVTLPILIYQAVGSYQMVLAAQLTLLLLVISAVIILAGEWLGGQYQNA